MKAERFKERELSRSGLYLVDSTKPVSKPERKKRKTPRWLKLIAAALGLYLLFLFGKSGYDIWLLKEQMTKLEEEQARILEHQKLLEQEVQSLNDPEVIEKLARENLGMVQQGETIIVPAIPGYDIPKPQAIQPGEITH